MSRNYHVNVEIAPLDKEELEATADKLRGVGFPIDTLWEDTIIADREVTTLDGGGFSCDINLAGGVDDQEMHQEVVKAFPDKCVTTKWKYIDFDDWDDVYEYDPEEEEDEDAHTD